MMPNIENPSGQSDESPNNREWEEIDGKPFRRQVPMPENWESREDGGWTAEHRAAMRAAGGIQRFWEYYEDGEIDEEWEIDD